MPLVQRVLDPETVPSLEAHCRAGGGDGLDAALALEPDAVIDEIARSGLRGRGGAGFPTGTKWAAVARFRSLRSTTTVVVNAAEGEPGTFKDRLLLSQNPYRVIEGALIAAHAVGARRLVIVTKESADTESRRLSTALAEAADAGWFGSVTARLVTGPSAYLLGEETALLEVVEGRQPFPRVTPPWRRGLDDGASDGGRNASDVDLAQAGGGAEPPALVQNVETLANVPGILAHGAEWFRELGTSESPGTIMVTITGATAHAGVAEVAMGTTLAEAIEEIGGGLEPGRSLLGVLPGASGAMLGPDQLDVALTFEDLAAIGSGLGSAGFTVYDDRTHPAAIAAGVARFLSVESCGQCTPCKRDGLAVSERLERIRTGTGGATEVAEVADLLTTITDGARCGLAGQYQAVLGGLLDRFGEGLVPAAAVEGVAVVPLLSIGAAGAVHDEDQLTKQPDWTFDETDSGTFPAERLADEPVETTATPGATDDGMIHASGTVGDREEALDETLVARLRSDHERLVEELHDVASSPDPDRATRAAHLVDHIRGHLDAVHRVLTPMVARAAPGAGDAANAELERLDDEIIELVDGTNGARESERPLDIGALDSALRRHAALEEGRVAPLLLSGQLDAVDLGELSDALVEAGLEVPSAD